MYRETHVPGLGDDRPRAPPANVDVVSTTVIARPREEVASYAADPDTATSWYENIVSSRREESGPLAVGSRVAFEARFLGKTLKYTYEVAEYVPGERLVMRTADGPFAMETTYAWRDVPGGTEMSLRNRGTPSGFTRVAAPLMKRAMRKANIADLARLKGILEHR